MPGRRSRLSVLALRTGHRPSAPSTPLGELGLRSSHYTLKDRTTQRGVCRRCAAPLCGVFYRTCSALPQRESVSEDKAHILAESSSRHHEHETSYLSLPSQDIVLLNKNLTKATLFLFSPLPFFSPRFPSRNCDNFA